MLEVAYDFCGLYLLLLHVTICVLLLEKDVKPEGRSRISNWKMFEEAEQKL